MLHFPRLLAVRNQPCGPGLSSETLAAPPCAQKHERVFGVLQPNGIASFGALSGDGER